MGRPAFAADLLLLVAEHPGKSVDLLLSISLFPINLLHFFPPSNLLLSNFRVGMSAHRQAADIFMLILFLDHFFFNK